MDCSYPKCSNIPTHTWCNTSKEKLFFCKKHIEEIKDIWDYQIVDGIYYCTEMGNENLLIRRIKMTEKPKKLTNEEKTQRRKINKIKKKIKIERAAGNKEKVKELKQTKFEMI